MLNIEIQFSSELPPKSEIGKLFHEASWNSSNEFIDITTQYKPHPVLQTIWVRVLQEQSCIGLARLYLPPLSPANPPAFIADFVVGAHHRGQGIGSFLFTKIEAYCQEYGIKLLALESNDSSLLFWRARKFTPKEQFPGLLFKTLS